MDDDRQALLAAAQQARRQAYAPYSRYHVGAAVRGGSGQIYAGCNVENSSYGLSICAERSAVFAAVLGGERRIDALALFSPASPLAMPCGACRQVLNEFASPDAAVIVANEQGEQRTLSLSEIFPYPFTLL